MPRMPSEWTSVFSLSSTPDTRPQGGQQGVPAGHDLLGLHGGGEHVEHQVLFLGVGDHDLFGCEAKDFAHRLSAGRQVGPMQTQGGYPELGLFK